MDPIGLLGRSLALQAASAGSHIVGIYPSLLGPRAHVHMRLDSFDALQAQNEAGATRMQSSRFYKLSTSERKACS